MEVVGLFDMYMYTSDTLGKDILTLRDQELVTGSQLKNLVALVMFLMR